MSTRTKDSSHVIHLLDTTSLSVNDITSIFDLAKSYVARNRKKDKKHPILKGRTIFNLFYENSTRTRASFELAGKRMGADVINLSVAHSSVAKGETLIDTAMTLDAMQADAIVIRHPEDGAARMISDYVKCSVINAGDGSHAHPTQALLDAMTILHYKKDITGLNIAICGDILGSRVARSNCDILTRLGANVTIVAPPPLMPAQPETLGVSYNYDMKKGLADADIVMMLRIQRERLGGHGSAIASVRDYFESYGLTHKKLALAKPDALVMHPGPINRGVEIETTIADDIERSVILTQVEMGVAVRMALLEWLLAR